MAELFDTGTTIVYVATAWVAAGVGIAALGVVGAIAAARGWRTRKPTPDAQQATEPAEYGRCA